MGARALLVCVLAFSCSRATPNKDPVVEKTQSPIAQLHTTCSTALKALLDGDYAQWQGVSGECTRVQIESVLPPGPDTVDRNSGTWGLHRMYPPSAKYPNGVTVWFDGDHMKMVRIRKPKPGRPAAEALGEPELKLPSNAGAYTQWVYASRGLTAHVRGDQIGWLYAYAPMTAEAYKSSAMRRVGVRREPIRR